MKIVTPKEVVLKLIEIRESRPDLYDKYVFLANKIKGLEYDKFKKYLAKELNKSRRSRSKEVKRIGGDNSYEFRIPPHHKDGVMRVKFKDEGDHYSIRLTDVFIKHRNS